MKPDSSRAPNPALPRVEERLPAAHQIELPRLVEPRSCEGAALLVLEDAWEDALRRYLDDQRPKRRKP